MVVDMEAVKTITTNDVPKWEASGDWFDVCKFIIPCPCIFAQSPSYGDCEGVLAYYINKISLVISEIHNQYCKV